jgi:hypothetical protein
VRGSSALQTPQPGPIHLHRLTLTHSHMFPHLNCAKSSVSAAIPVLSFPSYLLFAHPID